MNAGEIEWSAAMAPRPGEHESGDGYLICPLADGALCVAMDGLGHGAAAAQAVRVARQVLERHAGQPVTSLLERCHESLRSTRGAAISLATISTRDDAMSWAGVGNVEAILRRAKRGQSTERLLLRNGVVGSHLPPLQPAMITLGRGDVLVFTTDGVSAEAATEIPLQGPLQAIADRALAGGNKGNDDALVLLVRFRGVES